jgi:hypothetical protein
MRDNIVRPLPGIIVFIFILSVAVGQAGVVNTTNLTDVFNAIHVPPGTTGIYAGDPLAIGYSTAPLANFPPTPGTSFGILSTGKVTDIPDVGAAKLGTDLGDYGPDGDTASLTLTIPVPTWAKFLEFDFTFLSNEWPLFQFSYNDFFSAYLNGVNIALDGNSKPITVNNNYVSTTLTPDGTFFSAQTPLIHINVALPQGATSVTLQFQIGDATDGLYDSAVFFNNIFLEPAATYVNQYLYTCQLPDGNSYHGMVYAKNDKGYGIGWTGTMNNGQGQACTYQITDLTPGTGSFDAKQGQVYIDYYTDTGTSLTYIPLEYTQGLASGASYLGSEQYRGGIAQVTNNTGFDVAPQVLDNGRMLWQGWDTHDYEIYCLVPGQGVIQLTNNDSPDVMPQMNASGHLTWMNWDGSNWQVWYNLGSGPVQVIHSGGFNVLPQITADDQIYWQGWDGQDYEIFRYNPATQVTTQFTTNSLPDAAPQVNASGQLTWMEYNAGNWQVWYNTGSGPVQLTTSGANLSPQITDDGQIFWQKGDGQDYEIYRYNLGTSVTTQITNNTVDDVAPAVRNGVLVWSQWDGYYWQVYREVLGTGVITQITSDSHNNQTPRVNALGQIVWQKWDGNDFEVYAYK